MTPCAITEAVNNASDGDEVIVQPGDYGSPGARISTNLQTGADIVLHGAAAQPRPRIFSDATFALHLYHPDAVLRHLEVDVDAGGQNTGALRFDGRLAEDFVARGEKQWGCEILGSAIVRNGVCHSTGVSFSYDGLTVSGTLGPVPAVVIRNMTILSDDGYGMDVYSGTGRPAHVTVVNSIIRGGVDVSPVDIFVRQVGGADDDATVVASHDNFRASETLVQGAGSATIERDGTNQSATPLMVDPAAGDYHQLAGSPTIDAGLVSLLNGMLDFDSEPRHQGPSTDIGADEQPFAGRCRGRVPTHFGTLGPDTITGTNGADVVMAFSGSDRIDTLGGNDLVCAGTGNDVVFTRNGRDRAFGEGGNDRIFGGAARDFLFGQAGFDRLFGNNGGDRLFGGARADRIFGGRGNDRGFGGAGNDLLVGNAGRDGLFGQRGRDTLRGLAGRRDFCHGGPARDRRRAPGCEIRRSIP